MRVAVTGVGGSVGQSVMKALTLSTLPVEVFPVDIQPFSAGLFRAAKGAVLAKPESPGGLEEWERYLKDNRIEALIPGSDHDLLPLAEVRTDWADRDVSKVLISDPDLVKACRDKAATCRLLESFDLPIPKSTWDLTQEEAISWANSNGYPVVIKPRDGFGSRDVHVVENQEELHFYFPRTKGPILQEYLSASGVVEEFTCSVFVNREGVPLGSFMARRELSGGATYRAEVGHWPDIHDLLFKIGAALRPHGVINVQLRQTERGPVPFELNIRCSSTTAIRAYFGYNEPEMLLRHFVLGEDVVVPKSRKGYVMRYWNEIFLDGVGPDELYNGPNDYRGNILAWP